MLLWPAALAATAALASDDFLTNMHKAQSRKELPEQVEYYTRAIKSWASSDGNELLANCHYRRGQARYQLNQPRQAEPDLSKALDLDPNNAAAYLLRGRALSRVSRLDEAARDLSTYALMEPEDIEGWLALGQAEIKRGRHAAALQALRRAEQIDPADPRPALESARSWMLRKEWDKALERLSAADEAARGRSSEVFAERAVCEVAEGHNDKALEDYDEAIKGMDARLLDLSRAAAAPVEVADFSDMTARARFGRGRLEEFLVKIPEAMEDYRQACALGHKEACARGKALSRLRPEQVKPAVSAFPQPEPEPVKPAPQKRRRPVESDPGERIYAN